MNCLQGRLKWKKSALYFFFKEGETVKEGTFPLEEIEEKITQFLSDREYVELESVSEMVFEQESGEEPAVEDYIYEENKDQEKAYKMEMLRICLVEYKREAGIQAMLFDGFTSNQPLEKKAKLLRNFWLYDKEEKMCSYAFLEKERSCDITMNEQGIILERYLENDIVVGRDLVMDWQEAAGVVEKLFVEDKVPILEWDTSEEAQKAIKTAGFTEFLSEYQEIMKEEGIENASSIAQGFLEQYGSFLKGENIHQETRKQAVEALAQAELLVPDMLFDL